MNQILVGAGRDVDAVRDFGAEDSVLIEGAERDEIFVGRQLLELTLGEAAIEGVSLSLDGAGD